MSAQRQKKKATFTLDEAVLDDAKAIVRHTNYRSLNAFVEMAIVKLIEHHRKEELKRQLATASNDPLFLADIAEVQRDFQDADWDALGEDS